MNLTTLFSLTFKAIQSHTSPSSIVEAVNYATELLNSLNRPMTPSKVLQLKINVVIWLQNIHRRKVCNGTRLNSKKNNE